MRNEFKIGFSCPNCTAIFGLDEVLEETCFSCGFPNVSEENFEEDNYSNDDSDEEDIEN